jgi:alkylhydroperoxidase/carboxymuconolactone decarboxylase family protein YurZ
MARIVAAAARGLRDALPERYRAAAEAGIPAADLSEATLQVFLFAGYPRTIGAFEALKEALPDAATPPSEPERSDFYARGRATFQKVYGEHTDTVLAKLEGLHPDFARYVIHDAYGQVLGRPFLPLKERELLAVAMLAALDLAPQLRSHVHGAKKAGATEDEVETCRVAGREVAELRAG